MIRKKEESVSEGLTQVWAWKDAIHREVAHLPLDDALRVILDKASTVAAKYPQFRRATPLSR
jgi:hypothetical protein